MNNHNNGIEQIRTEAERMRQPNYDCRLWTGDFVRHHQGWTGMEVREIREIAAEFA
ncbi:hypothetical protein GNP94_11180 [Paenibacillus campinasensis]|uniref:Uncharacterized protein n=1 Tax=Paenibacillus campinasensis TaxID=66347 RepID=A0ABW9T0X4_9BACL|nr:hypothetical protein [Paenibacillus campinasensis]MUG66562.1 hypothetical protein [Paenibacillus campinasensis]